MTAAELRDFLLDRIANTADRSPIRSYDLHKMATYHTVTSVTQQLKNEGLLVSRTIPGPGGKLILFFANREHATEYMREYANGVSPTKMPVVFNKDARIVTDVTPTFIPSPVYTKLSSAHVSGSGYRTSV